MSNTSFYEVHKPDPAAVFAGALSLWQTAHRQAPARAVDLSDCFNGYDQLMREVMRIGALFEAWACAHVPFEALNEVWPYLLEARFGNACLDSLGLEEWEKFGEQDCLRVALRLGLPVRLADDGSVVPPIDLLAPCARSEGGFTAFRIRTMRERLETRERDRFARGDNPYDAEWGRPFFALSGVGADGREEPIADRDSYAATLDLARKIAPGIAFPDRPVSGP